LGFIILNSFIIYLLIHSIDYRLRNWYRIHFHGFNWNLRFEIEERKARQWYLGFSSTFVSGDLKIKCADRTISLVSPAIGPALLGAPMKRDKNHKSDLQGPIGDIVWIRNPNLSQAIGSSTSIPSFHLFSDTGLDLSIWLIFLRYAIVVCTLTLILLQTFFALA